MISDPAALTAEISDPSTSPQRLVEIAGSFAEFGPIVAEHPNATVDVLAYLLKHGDDATRKAAARRRSRDVAQITAGQRAPEGDAKLADDAKPSGEPAQAVPSPKQPVSSTERPASAAAFRTAPALADEVDSTQISQRSRAQTWRISVDGVGDVTFTATDILIGRKPAPKREHPEAELVTVPDPTKTVSKTHARLVRRGDQWMIVDLDSTNGVFVETSRGEQQIVAGSEIAVNGTFSLGDLRLMLSAD
jgi:hypothetical protein